VEVRLLLQLAAFLRLVALELPRLAVLLRQPDLLLQLAAMLVLPQAAVFPLPAEAPTHLPVKPPTHLLVEPLIRPHLE
jgi:hypothetical protein